jgi:hypothetical protein
MVRIPPREKSGYIEGGYRSVEFSFKGVNPLYLSSLTFSKELTHPL